MPPKKAAGGAQAKQAAQKKIQDATFGMKNKNKSKKIQQYVTNMEKQMNNQAKPKDPDAGKSKKALKAEKAAEMSEYFRPVVASAGPKLAPGEDPKSVLCEFFKLGTCTKGAKCKFSHDMALARKGSKIDMYTDRRDDSGQGDSMEDWDEDTLRQAVAKKEGRPNQTQIVCKYFLEAIDSKKYGWFWECPNGEKCQYRHALPPGFVFDKKEAKKEEEEDTVTVEQASEDERAKIRGGTPMTYELFLAWKEKKRLAREALAAERLEAAKKTRNLAGMTGREMFEFKPELFADDDEATTDNFAHQRATNSESISASFTNAVRESSPGAEAEGTTDANMEMGDSAEAPVSAADAPATSALDPSLFDDDDEDLE